MKNRFALAVPLILMIAGSTVGFADEYPQAAITTPVNNQAVSGQVPITAQISDDRGVVEVKFYYDYFRLFHSVSNSTPVPNANYSATLDTTGLPPGLHEINVKAYDIPGDFGHYGFYSIMVNVSSAPAPTPTPTCQDLRVYIQNRSHRSVSGNVMGVDGKTGAAGWLVNEGETIFRDLLTQPTPDSYQIQANIGHYGNHEVALSCQTTVASVNGCPAVGTNAVLLLRQRKGRLTCEFNTP